jgi:hypothetical protein
MDPEEVILNFFTTPDGRVSLKKIQEELTKSGLSGNPGVFEKMEEKAKTQGSFWAPIKKTFGRAISGIKNVFFKNPFSPVPPLVSEWDLTFSLALSPEAALKGTTVELQYYQDGLDRKLSVKVPPNTKDNSRLRLSGQGNLKPDGKRGDLLLNITIPKGDSRLSFK